MPSRLIGRARERQVLEEGLQAALAGRGSTVLLSGEAGIGKSTLAEDLAAKAAAKGARVAWGRCWEAGGAPAFWPWIQVVREVARAVDLASLTRLAGDRIAPLLELVPELRSAGLAAPEAQPDPAQARFRLLEAAAAFLGAAAEQEPALVIVLEDLHVADRSSLVLLDFVARSLAPVKALVVGTYREVEARLGDTGEAIAKVQRSARTLSLARFAADEIEDLLASHPGLPKDSVAGAVRASEGNPLFLTELIRVAEGSAGATMRVPDGIGAVIREHLSHLSVSTRNILEGAAVAGRELVTRSLTDFGFDPVLITDALGEGVRGGVLQEVAHERYRFTHVLLREEMLAAVPAARRTTLHRARAEALAARHEVDPAGAPASEIAHHFHEAGSTARPLAIKWYERAGEQALAQYAFDEAADALARAFALDPAEAPAARIERLLALARARILCGRNDEGRKACLDAADLARRIDSPELFARSILEYGSVYTAGLRNDLLASLLEEAISRLGTADHPLHARALARLAAALQPAPEGMDGPVRIAREAIAMARRIGDPRTTLDVFTPAMSAMMDQVDAAERIEINREHLALAKQERDLVNELRAWLRIALDQLELGHLKELEDTFSAYERVSERLGARAIQRWPLLLFRAVVQVARGNFAEADRLAAEAEAIGHAAGIAIPGRTAFLHKLGAARTRMKSRALGPLPASNKEWWGNAPNTQRYGQLFEALAAFWAGQILEFPPEFAHLEEFAPYADSMGSYVLAEIAVTLRDRRRAALLLPLVEERAERWSSWGFIGMTLYAPYAHVQGQLLALLERWDEAEPRFAAAQRMADEVGAAPIAARLRWEHALALRTRGRPADEERIAQLAAVSRAEATRLGMDGLLARLDELGAAPLAQPVAAALPVASGFRMSAEGEYWSVASDGTTIRLRDSRGLRMLARLVADPGREFHALDLDGAADGADAGDGGELLDEKSKLAYKKRVEELREELAEAEEWNDSGRAETAREELESLQAELSRAVGLGGRARRTGGAAERARVNVQRRLKDALRRIAEGHPALGRHLEWAVKTGVFCSYDPR